MRYDTQDRVFHQLCSDAIYVLSICLAHELVCLNAPVNLVQFEWSLCIDQASDGCTACVQENGASALCAPLIMV